MERILETMRRQDWPAVHSIFEDGIATGDATFETQPLSYEEWDRSHLEACRVVAREGDVVVGWAALTPISDRCVYDGVAEVSVYVATSARGRGVGGELLDFLVRCSEETGFWTLQAGILPENEASLRLHRAFGFREVGVRERLGKLGDRWRDVVLLERRSKVVGR
jgi:phosphinothricin acetyltransferase